MEGGERNGEQEQNIEGIENCWETVREDRRKKNDQKNPKPTSPLMPWTGREKLSHFLSQGMLCLHCMILSERDRHQVTRGRAHTCIQHPTAQPHIKGP